MTVFRALQLMMLVIAEMGNGVVSADQPSTDPTVTESVHSQKSNISFMNQNNMTTAQKDSVVTIEFNFDLKGQNTSTPNYAQIRKAIIDQLNKRPRPTRRPRTRTSTISPTTMETTTMETTTMEITTMEITTPEITTLATTTLETTAIPIETTTAFEETTTTETVTSATTVATRPPRTPEPPPNWARFRREAPDPTHDYDYYEDETDSTPYYTEDDLTFVLVEPLVVDGVLRVSFVVEKDDAVVKTKDVLDAAIALQDSGQLEQQAEMPVIQIYQGLPGYEIGTNKKSAALDWRFILALIFLLVLFIILICAFFCIRRHPRRPVPIDDSQSPMLHAESNSPCQQQPNGTSTPPYLHEEDCYIVPYDELLLAQKDTKSPNTSGISDLEHTRL